MGKASNKKKLNYETLRKTLTIFLIKSKYATRLRAFALNKYLHLFIIALIGITVYSNTFHSPFEFDDIEQIENNHMIKALDNFLLVLQGHNFSSSVYCLSRRSVGYLSFALNYHFGGLDVKGYHLVNLFIHIANALLVYFFVKLTFKTPYFDGERSEERRQDIGDESRPIEPEASQFTIHDSRSSGFIALLSALLFVSHPIQTQAVTYIVQRFASLATLFYLLAIVLYIKGRLKMQSPKLIAQSVKNEERRLASPMCYALSPMLYYSFSLLSAILAMGTKEIAFTLPLVIILYESIFFTAPLKKKLLFFLPIALTLIIVPLSVMHIDKPLGEILSDINERTRVETDMSRWDYLMTEMRVITTYIRLIFLPVNQNLDYDYPISRSLFDLPVLFSFLFLAAIFVGALYLLHKTQNGKLKVKSKKSEQTAENLSSFTFHLSRLFAFGILWFFITLSVESSIIPIADVIFEHRVYLPSVGFLTAITAGMFTVAARLKKEKVAVLILVLITLALSVATYARNNTWKDGVSLWEDVVRKSPNKSIPHFNLALNYSALGRNKETLSELQSAVKLDPDFAKAHFSLGLEYIRLNIADEALSELQAVIRIDPDYPMAGQFLDYISRMKKAK